MEAWLPPIAHALYSRPSGRVNVQGVGMDWFARREEWTAQAEDAQEDGDVDYARVIHSASFRRLQGNTQILSLGDSDFYRTRLTHPLAPDQPSATVSRRSAHRTSHRHAVFSVCSGVGTQESRLTPALAGVRRSLA